MDDRGSVLPARNHPNYPLVLSCVVWLTIPTGIVPAEQPPSGEYKPTSRSSDTTEVIGFTAPSLLATLTCLRKEVALSDS